MNRQVYKQQPRHFDGYRRTNYCIDIRTYEINNIVYRIAPIGIGKLTNLRSKVQVIIGQNRIILNGLIHPLFQYFMLMFALFRGMSFGFKQQKIKSKLIEELIFDLSNKKCYGKLCQKISSIVAQVCQKQVQSLFKDKSRLQKLEVYEAFLDREEIKTIEKTKQFTKNQISPGQMYNQTKELLISTYYITQQIRAIRNIQPLTYAQQYQQFKIFQKKHQGIFKAQLQIDRYQQYYFLLAKISTQAEPVLQRLTQFVDLRFQGTNYSTESALFVKDIYNQLKKYDQQIIHSTKQRDPYIYLNPSNVIIDQFSFKVILHFEPLLLQALGLKGKPRSLEGRLTFEPTPKGIDYFKTTEQYDQKLQKMRRDPLYGCSQLYIAEKQSVDRTKIQNQKKELDENKDTILTWRFLLLAYFIRTNSEFGRLQNASSEKQALVHFFNVIKAKKNALKSNASQLEEFIGATKNNAQGASFEGNFEELGDFLSGEKDDSVIQRHGYDRTVRYSSLRWILMRQASSILQYKDNSLFYKLINAKKYTILFLLAGEQIYQEAERLTRWERERSGQRKHVREILQASIKRSKKDKPYDYVKTIFAKIKEYLQRSNSDPGYCYFSDSDFYIYKYLQQIHNDIISLKALTDKLDAIEARVDPKDRQLYKQTLLQTETFVKTKYPYLVTLLKEIIYVEIDQAKDNIHKVSSKEPQSLKSVQLITKKFVLTTFTLLSLNEVNSALYESLVIPLLNLVESGGQYDQNVVAALSKQELARLAEDLQTVGDLIQYEQIKPKKLILIRGNQYYKH